MGAPSTAVDSWVKAGTPTARLVRWEAGGGLPYSWHRHGLRMRPCLWVFGVHVGNGIGMRCHGLMRRLCPSVIAQARRPCRSRRTCRWVQLWAQCSWDSGKCSAVVDPLCKAPPPWRSACCVEGRGTGRCPWGASSAELLLLLCVCVCVS